MFKHTQRGSATVLILAAIAILVLGGIFAITSYISAANFGNASEQSLIAKHDDLKNIKSNYTLKVAEIAQVPQAYRKDLEKVIAATFEGRYGEQGVARGSDPGKQTWQWLQEQNPSLDSSLYARIQQVMESGRNEFTVAQTEFLDMKRAYKTELGYVWRGFWLGLAGYPKIDLSKYNTIVDSGTTEQFRTGVDEAIKLPAE